MNYNLSSVPWYNSTEWHTVYENLYSERPNYQRALNLLLVWKARSSLLPSGIESTLCLLQVRIQDLQSSSNLAGDEILRFAYSSAIMRFVNHMLDSETAKGSSLYQAAKSLGVPDWIVDLRHDTAHNNTLPTLVLLQNACLFGLQWLQINYWDKHKQCILDYECGGAASQNFDEAKIGAAINFLSSLSICKRTHVKKVSDIPYMDLRESILHDAKQSLENAVDFSNFKNMSITNLVNILIPNLRKYLKHRKPGDSLNKSLLGEDSLLLSLDLVLFMCGDDYSTRKLSRSYLECFEVFLTVLHTNDLILDLILALVEVTKGTNPDRALLAALWISEILKALKASKQFIARTLEMSSDGVTSNKKKDLKQMYHHWFPNEKEQLVLNLQKPVPSQLKDIHFIKPIISNYNAYLVYFVNDFLVLLEPQLPKLASQKIYELAKLISSPENHPVNMETSKIYTIDDFIIEEDEMDTTNNRNEEVESRNNNEMLTNNEMISNDGQIIWKLASKNHNWANCPIGVLPWQQIRYTIEES